MREKERTENRQSTPTENKKEQVKYHANQSSDASKRGGSMGIVAIVIIVAIIVLGLLFFSDVFA